MAILKYTITNDMFIGMPIKVYTNLFNIKTYFNDTLIYWSYLGIDHIMLVKKFPNNFTYVDEIRFDYSIIDKYRLDLWVFNV